MLRRVLVPVALVAGLLVPATAGATVVTSTAQGVSASLSYTGHAGTYRGLSLSITRGGTSVYHAPVRATGCGSDCWPAIGAGSHPVSVLSLSGAGSADVVLGLYTGGANCCFVAQVFAPTRSGSSYGLLAQRNFDTYGYRVVRLGGASLFSTGNAAFDTTFTDFAASGQPVQLLAVRGSRFVDVTRRYPAVLRADAARWLTAYRKADGKDDVGLIAPWAADEALLGRSTQAFAYLDTQARAGRLVSSFGAGESGTRFVSKLRTLLKREGDLS